MLCLQNITFMYSINLLNCYLPTIHLNFKTWLLCNANKSNIAWEIVEFTRQILKQIITENK